ncbi:hypothetical protein AYR62_12300 [Secundilactobacillus paracollinoides]|uniref:Uncharacterized protein n=1 Tax=Secundilactobacillus paracollinoides TaxID=240427 RepID=A0A1B2IW47_9LACO|nr:hypothetical protein [Secundilactobacillus paracollinoides]ANZ60469.1 hypothetical protein AYR61_03330 [Secundilactobacillus paracollinoides]ANZ64782.1 hypothetical protein AYR62_12300 [Secundilactobacillus paracollinoides]ANZ66296.1 hypothetical protein AYR63_03525 [Secundilactobacillus paracollinoides]KRL79130.1 hypothetical protein FC17_GL000666 [Secundilactobacillus paracollinoides DSM 15502 = JCM 11969]
MDIAVADFIEKVETEQVTSQTFEITRGALDQQGDKAVLTPIVEFVAETVKKGELASAILSFTDAEIEFRLETSIINLPLRYVNTIKKMLSDEDDMAVNIYSVLESPDVNQSSLRIDKVASVDDFQAHQDVMAESIGEWLDTQLAAIKTNEEHRAETDALKAKEETESDKKPAKKTAAKKTAKKTTKKES